VKADHQTDSKLTGRAVLNAGMAALATAGSALSVPQGPQQHQTGPKRDTADAGRFTPSEPANAPLGVGKGIHPGRVVWAYEPRVALWDGKTGNWWEETNTNSRLVDTMVSGSLQALTGERSDKAAWSALFKFFNQTRSLGSNGHRAGEKIAIKLNSNQDRPDAWRFGAGMPTPQIRLRAAAPTDYRGRGAGQDITFYDASRYSGDPVYDRIRANHDPNFQAVRFVVSQRMAGNGRIAALPDKANPIRFSYQGVPTAYVPQCVTEAKYLINTALPRAHGLADVTQAAKNLFGSVYFEGPGFIPQPLHDYVSRDRPMGSYNCLVDLIAHKHLGGKTLLYMLDFMYVAESRNVRVIKYQSFLDNWFSSPFMSQDPVAIDSVGLDFIRNEPRAAECRRNPDNYLHEAALTEDPPSGTVYDSSQEGKPVRSLGVHEHSNNAHDRKYTRNLGKREGIELVALRFAAGIAEPKLREYVARRRA
jgi:hypothetical protein